MFTPSPYQAEFFRLLQDPLGPKSIVMNARAGTGKSTTAAEGCRGLPGSGKTFKSGDPMPSVLVTCFNKAIKEELAQMMAGLPHVDVKGLHQCGLKTISLRLGREIQVAPDRYWKMTVDIVREAVALPLEQSLLDLEVHALLVRASVGNHSRVKAVEVARKEVYPVLRAARDLANFARLTLTDPSDWEALRTLAVRFDKAWPEWAEPIVFNLVGNLLARGCDRASIQTTGIDHTDMLWLPIVLGLRPYWRYSYVMVDEAQDLSPVMLELILSHVGGRFVALGDPEQAVNAFAGADADSFVKIIARTGATVLPLPRCYRCDTRIVKVASYWTPDIEARADAEPGIVAVLSADNFGEKVRPGDLVLARTNKVLVDCLFYLLQKGKPAKVKGRPGLTEELVGVADCLQQIDPGAWTDPAPAAAQYREAEAEKILKQNRGDRDDPRLDLLGDRVAAVVTLMLMTKACRLEDFEIALKALFEDTPGVPASYITLSSSHRAKGLGCDRVFVLAPELYPIGARTSADRKQEQNLMYVTVTRAKHELYFVGGWGGFLPAVAKAGLLPLPLDIPVRNWDDEAAPADHPGAPVLDLEVYRRRRAGPPAPPAAPAAPVESVSASAASPAVPEAAAAPAVPAVAPAVPAAEEAFWTAVSTDTRGPEVEQLWRRGELPRAVGLARQVFPDATRELLAAVFGPVYSGSQTVVPP